MSDYGELHSAVTLLAERVAPCSICGSTEWEALDRPVLHPFFEEANSEVVEVSSEGFPTLAYICVRCAHVRLFGVYKLRQLIAAAKREHIQGNGH